jgi:Zinc finger, C2H2 type
MLNHVEIMHNNKLIYCNLCNKSYKSKSGLVYHMKFVHNQNNIFTFKKNLLDHQKICSSI